MSYVLFSRSFFCRDWCPHSISSSVSVQLGTWTFPFHFIFCYTSENVPTISKSYNIIAFIFILIKILYHLFDARHDVYVIINNVIFVLRLTHLPHTRRNIRGRELLHLDTKGKAKESSSDLYCGIWKCSVTEEIIWSIWNGLLARENLEDDDWLSNAW